jgi:hypothetical protein
MLQSGKGGYHRERRCTDDAKSHFKLSQDLGLTSEIDQIFHPPAWPLHYWCAVPQGTACVPTIGDGAIIGGEDAGEARSAQLKGME